MRHSGRLQDAPTCVCSWMHRWDINQITRLRSMRQTCSTSIQRANPAAPHSRTPPTKFARASEGVQPYFANIRMPALKPTAGRYQESFFKLTHVFTNVTFEDLNFKPHHTSRDILAGKMLVAISSCTTHSKCCHFSTTPHPMRHSGRLQDARLI